jgi:hypothetical protein
MFRIMHKIPVTFRIEKRRIDGIHPWIVWRGRIALVEGERDKSREEFERRRRNVLG